MKKALTTLITLTFLASLASCSSMKRPCKSAWESMQKGANCRYIY